MYENKVVKISYLLSNPNKKIYVYGELESVIQESRGIEINFAGIPSHWSANHNNAK